MKYGAIDCFIVHSDLHVIALEDQGKQPIAIASNVAVVYLVLSSIELISKSSEAQEP